MCPHVWPVLITVLLVFLVRSVWPVPQELTFLKISAYNFVQKVNPLPLTLNVKLVTFYHVYPALELRVWFANLDFI